MSHTARHSADLPPLDAARSETFNSNYVLDDAHRDHINKVMRGVEGWKFKRRLVPKLNMKRRRLKIIQALEARDSITTQAKAGNAAGGAPATNENIAKRISRLVKVTDADLGEAKRILSRSVLGSLLPDEVVDQLVRSATLEAFLPKEIIVHKNETTRTVGVLIFIRGAISSRTVSPNLKKYPSYVQVVTDAVAPQLTGDVSIITEEPQQEYIVARSLVEALHINPNVAKAALCSLPPNCIASLEEHFSGYRQEALALYYYQTVHLTKISWLFRSLSDKIIQSMIDGMVPMCIFPGQVLVSEGHFCPAMHFIRRGTLRVSVRGVHKETLTAGVSFGEMSLLFNERRTVTVVAETICDVWRLDRQRVHMVLDDEPATYKQLIAAGCGVRTRWLQLQRFTADIAAQLRKVPILRHCRPETLERLLAVAQPVVFTQRKVVASIVDSCDHLTLILRGTAQSTRADLRREFRPGDHLGSTCLVYHKNLVSICTTTMVDAWVIDHRTLRHVLRAANELDTAMDVARELLVDEMREIHGQDIRKTVAKIHDRRNDQPPRREAFLPVIMLREETTKITKSLTVAVDLRRDPPTTAASMESQARRAKDTTRVSEFEESGGSAGGTQQEEELPAALVTPSSSHGGEHTHEGGVRGADEPENSSLDNASANFFDPDLGRVEKSGYLGLVTATPTPFHTKLAALFQLCAQSMGDAGNTFFGNQPTKVAETSTKSEDHHDAIPRKTDDAPKIVQTINVGETYKPRHQHTYAVELPPGRLQPAMNNNSSIGGRGFISALSTPSLSALSPRTIEPGSTTSVSTLKLGSPRGLVHPKQRIFVPTAAEAERLMTELTNRYRMDTLDLDQDVKDDVDYLEGAWAELLNEELAAAEEQELNRLSAIASGGPVKPVLHTVVDPNPVLRPQPPPYPSSSATSPLDGERRQLLLSAGAVTRESSSLLYDIDAAQLQGTWPRGSPQKGVERLEPRSQRSSFRRLAKTGQSDSGPSSGTSKGATTSTSEATTPVAETPPRNVESSLGQSRGGSGSGGSDFSTRRRRLKQSVLKETLHRNPLGLSSQLVPPGSSGGSRDGGHETPRSDHSQQPRTQRTSPVPAPALSPRPPTRGMQYRSVPIGNTGTMAVIRYEIGHYPMLAPPPERRGGSKRGVKHEQGSSVATTPQPSENPAASEDQATEKVEASKGSEQAAGGEDEGQVRQRVKGSRLTLQVIEASELLSLDMFSKSDPYAVIHSFTAKGETEVLGKTKSMSGTFEPKWNATFEFPEMPSDLTRVKIMLYDENMIMSDEFMGMACLPIHGEKSSSGEQTLTLIGRDDAENADEDRKFLAKKGRDNYGKLKVGWRYEIIYEPISKEVETPPSANESAASPPEEPQGEVGSEECLSPPPDANDGAAGISSDPEPEQPAATESHEPSGVAVGEEPAELLSGESTDLPVGVQPRQPSPDNDAEVDADAEEHQQQDDVDQSPEQGGDERNQPDSAVNEKTTLDDESASPKSDNEGTEVS